VLRTLYSIQGVSLKRGMTMSDAIEVAEQPKEEYVNQLTAQVEWTAKMCHEVNRAYCLALGDDSQPSWADAPDWQKESAFKGVVFHLSIPGAGPEASHEAWLRQKEEDGWVYGETKDPEAKTHPCMIPFDQLPVEQKAKDHIFRAIVHQCFNLPDHEA
jgi:hypothetical protein